MNRLLLPLFLLAICQESSFATVYKCEHEGGKVEYQSLPCGNGHEVKITASGATVPSATPVASATGEKKKCSSNQEMHINFAHMPVRELLRVLADVSGNKLTMDPSVSGAGAFNYECVTWEAVLQDVASRYGLDVKVENGTIFAKKR
jgi:hypothetical protein